MFSCDVLNQLTFTKKEQKRGCCIIIEFPFQTFSRLFTNSLMKCAPEKKFLASKLHDRCLLMNAILDNSVVNAVIKLINQEEQVNLQFPVFFLCK